MIRFVVWVMLILGLCAQVCADPDPQQIITTSWPGLSGLFIIPTARMIGHRNFAVGFNESKHTEYVMGEKYTDRQIRGVFTYGVADWLEITGAYYNDMYTIPPGVEPSLNNQTFSTYGLKFRVMQEHPHYWYPEVSIGIRDIGNDTIDVGPLRNVNNGRKIFILASKRMLKNCETGRFMDVHAGVSYDHAQPSGLVGFELTLAPNASLIVEGIWDSPYLNFRRYGLDDQPGRFLFNTGLRVYPELVPHLVLDMGFVGDSEFEFSFAASYVMNF